MSEAARIDLVDRAPLTEKQQNVYESIMQYQRVNGYEITDDIFDLEEFVKTITDMGIWLYSLEVGPVPIIVSHAEDFGC